MPSAATSEARRTPSSSTRPAKRLVELGAAGCVRALEVGGLQRLAQHGAREHARLRGRAPLGLDGVEVADDEQDRGRGEREPDPGADGEAEDEARRIAVHGYFFLPRPGSSGVWTMPPTVPTGSATTVPTGSATTVVTSSTTSSTVAGIAGETSTGVD